MSEIDLNEAEVEALRYAYYREKLQGKLRLTLTLSGHLTCCGFHREAHEAPKVLLDRKLIESSLQGIVPTPTGRALVERLEGEPDAV